MTRTATSKAPRRKGVQTSSHYSRWSKGEVRELRQLARAHMSMHEIGRKLGRTEISIRGKAQREGISLASDSGVAFGRPVRSGR